VHLFRRESQEAYAQAEASLTFAYEHGFALWVAYGTTLQGWALLSRSAQSGTREQREAGLAQLQKGLAAIRDMEAELWVPLFLGALAQGYGQSSQAEEGLKVVAEALAMAEKNEERWSEAELYRLKGTLTLQSKVQGPKSKVEEEAEECFLKAIAIAQKQQAKSLELRAVMSLVRLRQRQTQDHATRTTQHEARTKLDVARAMLSEVYNWFTEGFDTKDLQEAKALIETLGH
jgi:predicted ATPase